MNKYPQFSKASSKQLYDRIHRKDAVNCIKKMSWSSKEKADQFALDKGYVLRAYLCDYCGRWHTSSKGV